MSIQPNDSQNFESFVPEYDYVPEDWTEARQFLIEHLKKISEAINAREIGFFLNDEVLSGKQFYPSTNNNQEYRSILRTIVPFGALPNSGTKTVAHNVTIDGNFRIIDLYLSATNPIALTGFSLQYFSIAAGDIVLSYDATNVIVTTASNYTAYSDSYVIMEYIKEG